MSSNGRPAFLSASGLSRASKCAAAYALPSTWEPSSPAAARGTAIHAFLEGMQVAMPSAEASAYQQVLAAAPDDIREQLDALDLGEFPLGDAETAFAVDAVTGAARALGHIKGRSYPSTAPTEITGTADLVTWDGRCIDWKAGNIDYVEPASESMQLAFHALAISRTRGLDAVPVAIAHVDLDAGRISYDWYVHDAMTLDAFGEELAALHATVSDARAQVRRGEMPATTPGQHCKWCPAAKRCPEIAADTAALATVAESSWMERVHTDLAAPGGVEKWHRHLPVMESIVDSIKGAIRSEVKTRGPIALADGGTLSLESRTRKSVDASALRAELESAVGSDAMRAIEAANMKTTTYEQLTERKAKKAGRAA